ncbi:hypothetical protein B5M42_002535 [Paenibacillus athensensis]|nr:hypothetical protein [Paenibacillus athensensis]MCD1257716.1 hypothetical protein [Paenibacillus athensensis]
MSNLGKFTKNTAIVASAAVVVGATGLVTGAEASKSGVVSYVYGTVTVTKVSTGKSSTPFVGLSLYEGDKVVTGNGTLTYKINNQGDTYTVLPYTTHTVPKPANNCGEFCLETPTAIMGVRG